ncbi:MAG: IS1595 family transposase [bacterium]|nr:IS1595 family transposase [bacterium]
MVEYPRTTIEFHDMFASENDCMRYLERIRFDQIFSCPHCRGTHARRRTDGAFRCLNCGRNISVKSGTIFHQSHIPLRTWFHAIWEMVSHKQGVSALGLQQTLGMRSHATAWDMLRKLRQAMVRPDQERLSGLVEVDETIIGGLRPFTFGRTPTSKVLVLIAVEDKGVQGMGRIRLKVIPDAGADMLERGVRSMAALESCIRTDGFKGYLRLFSLGYGHTMIKKRDVKDGSDTTPLVHRVASLLKRWLLSTHQGAVHAEYLQEYLNEFTFRFNRRRSRSRGLLFYRLVEIACAKRPDIHLPRERKKKKSR